MNFWGYFCASALACMSVIYYAVYTHQQFYPIVLFLVTSKVSFVFGGNMCLAILLVVARMLKTIFFSNLREAEIEMLVEKSKYIITETCLALTIFRNELNLPVMTLFSTLIFVKLFHRLAKTRAQYLEQIMPISRFANLQVASLFLFLIIIDLFGIQHAVSHLLLAGKSVVLLFGFEFGLLLVHVFNTMVRFILHSVDASMEHGMQSKGLYIMMIDLFCEVIRFVTYLFFFSLVFVYYGIPMHIMRDVWSAYFSFHKKLVNFIKFLKLTKNMEDRYVNATAEELAQAGSCLVCREEMDMGKKLPCGHVFHLNCLRSWLQHQQSCPLCRADISGNSSTTPANAAAAAGGGAPGGAAGAPAPAPAAAVPGAPDAAGAAVARAGPIQALAREGVPNAPLPPTPEAQPAQPAQLAQAALTPQAQDEKERNIHAHPNVRAEAKAKEAGERPHSHLLLSTALHCTITSSSSLHYSSPLPPLPHPPPPPPLLISPSAPPLASSLPSQLIPPSLTTTTLPLPSRTLAPAEQPTTATSFTAAAAAASAASAAAVKGNAVVTSPLIASKSAAAGFTTPSNNANTHTNTHTNATTNANANASSIDSPYTTTYHNSSSTNSNNNNQQLEALPAFFVTCPTIPNTNSSTSTSTSLSLSDGDGDGDCVVVRSEPIPTATHIRAVAPHTILFATNRLTSSDGSKWLRVPDGWVLEHASGESNPYVRLLHQFSALSPSASVSAYGGITTTSINTGNDFTFKFTAKPAQNTYQSEIVLDRLSSLLKDASGYVKEGNVMKAGVYKANTKQSKSNNTISTPTTNTTTNDNKTNPSPADVAAGSGDTGEGKREKSRQSSVKLEAAALLLEANKPTFAELSASRKVESRREEIREVKATAGKEEGKAEAKEEEGKEEVSSRVPKGEKIGSDSHVIANSSTRTPPTTTKTANTYNRNDASGLLARLSAKSSEYRAIRSSAAASVFSPASPVAGGFGDGDSLDGGGGGGGGDEEDVVRASDMAIGGATPPTEAANGAEATTPATTAAAAAATAAETTTEAAATTAPTAATVAAAAAAETGDTGEEVAKEERRSVSSLESADVTSLPADPKVAAENKAATGVDKAARKTVTNAALKALKAETEAAGDEEGGGGGEEEGVEDKENAEAFETPVKHSRSRRSKDRNESSRNNSRSETAKDSGAAEIGGEVKVVPMSAERLRNVATIEEQMLALTQNLTALSKSVLVCQRALHDMISEEAQLSAKKAKRRLSRRESNASGTSTVPEP